MHHSAILFQSGAELKSVQTSNPSTTSCTEVNVDGCITHDASEISERTWGVLLNNEIHIELPYSGTGEVMLHNEIHIGLPYSSTGEVMHHNEIHI